MDLKELNKETPHKFFWKCLNLPQILPFLFCLGIFLIWSYILAYKYFHFGYYDWDLAIYSNALWNMSRGSFYSPMMGINFFANHAEFIAFFIAPLYRIVGHPLLLLDLKILSFVIGVYWLFRMAKSKLDSFSALILAVLYLIYPTNIFALIYEFHYESLNIAFLFLLYYAFRENKYFLFLISAFFLALIKENMPLIVIAFGIVALFSREKEKIKWVVVPIVFGAAIFSFYMFFLSPLLHQSLRFPTYQYLGLYSNVGNSLPEIISTVLFQPVKIVKILYKPENMGYLNEMLSPLMFLPVFSPQVLIFALPIFLQNLLSHAWQQKTIYYHYAGTLAPFLFLAMLESLSFIRRRFHKIVYGAILVMVSVTVSLNSLNYIKMYKQIYATENSPLTPIKWKMLKQIPPDAGVMATLDALTVLSSRKTAYSFLNVSSGTQALSFSPFQFKHDVEYVWVDFANPWLIEQVFKYQGSPELVRDFFGVHNWKVQDAINDVVLFKKADQKDSPLVEVTNPSTSENGASSLVVVDKNFRLLDFDATIKQTPEARKLWLKLSWQCNALPEDFYKVGITLKGINGTYFLGAHIVGYFVYPTKLWQPGDFVKENVWLFLPQIPPGEYSVLFTFLSWGKNIFGDLSLDSGEFAAKNQHSVVVGKIQLN